MLNTLACNGATHRIEPKVMKVLVVLASQPNQVVLKDDLMQSVWPETYVSDDVLTRCISLLRHIMHDNPHDPHFIQTIPKVGYRLVGEVQGLPAVKIPPVLPSADEPTAEATSPARARKQIPGVGIAFAWLLVLGLVGVLAWFLMRGQTRPAAAIRTSQFTSNAGMQSSPAFSPDGKMIAFVWTAENDKSQHIYMKALGSETLTRLTNQQGAEYSPVWSPDGQQIAYLSISPTGTGLYLASATPGESSRKIYIPQEPTRWDQGNLSWSPDGKSIILADHIGGAPHSSIYRIDIESRKMVSLTTPPSGWEGDMNPSYSPDGRKIAFIRASETAVSDLYWIDSSGGGVRRLTQDGRHIDSFAWAADGRSVIFSSDRGGKYALWRVRLDRATPERMPVGTEDATQPSVAAKNDLLAYTHTSALWSILRIPEGSKPGASSQSAALVSSTQQDSAPTYAPDGSHFAFQSWRSGNQNIWIASADGRSLRQLTSFTGNLTGSPAWSLRGDQIVFDSRIEGHSHIFVVSSQGGQPRQLTFGDANDIVPRWSANNNSIYFRSNREGRWQIWKMPASGGTAQPVTSDDGMIAQESADGKWLYFTRGYEAGLWRTPTTGGAITRVLDQPAAGYWGYWAITRRGIYYLDQRGSQPAIVLYNPVTQRSVRFATLDRLPPPYSGICVEPDERAVLITDERNAESHITLAEGLP
jgi:Tol biopolymer transport system component/DNA-binding winged helix-turn-helix (wHTH) protein